MSGSQMKKLISVLMDSPLYMTLSAQERISLIKRLSSSYPLLFEGENEEQELGYESSWAGIHRGTR